MPTDQVCLGRKRPVPSCPNPLFLQWLTELRGSAKEKGLKTQYVYQKVSDCEAKILLNFGDGICKILDERLQKHYRENGEGLHTASSKQMEEPQKEPSGNFSEHMKQTQKEVRKEKGAKKKREYVPQKRSGGYAVLLTLYRHTQMPGSKGFMFRNELQTEAQPLCEKSFTVPDLGSKYTAWSSVSTLIQKVLLVKTHNPASLSSVGLALAEKLDSEETGMAKEHVEQMSEEEDTRDGPDVADLTLEEEDEEDQEEKEITFPNTAYDIVLCVDFIETTGGSSGRKQELVKELQRNGVTFDVRKLNVGDFLWVAPEKVTPVPGQLRPPVGIELVLDYITERKRMDDLCGSIIDGRFREQKFRLKRCGLRKPIYLVEECGPVAAHLSIPESTLQQAIVNTQVVDGFFVKHVQDVKESAAYLTIMTRYLQKLYQNCTLFCRSRELVDDGEDKSEQMANLSCSLMAFTELKYGAIKNKCQMREVFARQLMQISYWLCFIFLIIYYFSSLLQAYDQCSDETDKEKLLSSIKYGKLKRNIGPASSRTIYQLYCTRGPLS
uniref:Crossover junction endonuclease MUS81 n=1 Tax=Sinocyclocheilus anshuiensis TaxID=1608454 RepID=A0A671PC25_9TELE